MSRTLHVIDQAGQVAPATVLRLSVDEARYGSQGTGNQHAWLLIGGEPMRDAADAVGLCDRRYQLIARPTGFQKRLPHALAKPRQLVQQAHRVLCWTEGAAEMVSRFSGAHAVRRINDAARCPLAAGLIEQAQQDLSTQPGEREALRQQWGVEPGTVVVALLSDRLDQLDASAAVMTVNLTDEALRASQPEHAGVRLLCHPLTKRRDQASVFSELLHVEHLMIQEGRTLTPWSVMPGSDLALAPMPSEAGLSILWAMAMGVPVMTPGPSQGTLSARSSKPSDLADALTQWAIARALSTAGV